MYKFTVTQAEDLRRAFHWRKLLRVEDGAQAGEGRRGCLANLGESHVVTLPPRLGQDFIIGPIGQAADFDDSEPGRRREGLHRGYR